MKIIFGGWTPSLIIDLINSGVDMFDSSFTYLTTERNSAFVFDYILKYKWEIFLSIIYIYFTVFKIIILITLVYRNECLVMDIPHCANNQNTEKSNIYEICLTDKR